MDMKSPSEEMTFTICCRHRGALHSRALQHTTAGYDTRANLCELAGGCQHERLAAAHAHLQLLQDADGEGGRLARPCTAQPPRQVGLAHSQQEQQETGGKV